MRSSISFFALVLNSTHLLRKYTLAPTSPPPITNACAMYSNTPVAMLYAFRKNDKNAMIMPEPISTKATIYDNLSLMVKSDQCEGVYDVSIMIGCLH